MIKRIIFDLDNTLIEWKDEYNKIVEESLKDVQYPYTQELVDKINEKEDEYGKTSLIYSKKGLLDYLNKELNLELPIEFVDGWVKRARYCVPKQMEKDDYETLEYLSNKYELVVLTNYVGETQKSRLENLGVLKFFKNIYGGDEFTKPHKESFWNALGNHRLDECAMIGDNLYTDIKGAKDAGMTNVVWKDNNNQFEEYKESLKDISIIKDLKDLKKIF